MCKITILCLANSRKPPSGRCIAGKRLENGRATTWLRPVSARTTHEVSEEERRYEEGTKAQLLDIVSIPLLQASPFLHQVENYTLDDKCYWVKKGTATWTQIQDATDAYDAKFWSHSERTYHGLNDKVAETVLGSIGSSLKLIMVCDLEISCREESGFQGQAARRRVRGQFTYQGQSYLMSVTDPEIEERYLIKGNGIYQIRTAALCISLVEPFNGYAYRVIASVITQERCEAAS